MIKKIIGDVHTKVVNLIYGMVDRMEARMVVMMIEKESKRLEG